MKSVDEFFAKIKRLSEWMKVNGAPAEGQELYEAAFSVAMPSEVFGETEIVLKRIRPAFLSNPAIDSQIAELLKEIDDAFKSVGDIR